MQKELEQYAVEQLKQWGLWQKGWRFRWNSSKRSAGQCWFNHEQYGNHIALSETLAAARSLADSKDTILHEIAHALSPKTVGHNWQWRQNARMVGAKPKRCVASSSIDHNKISFKYTGTCPTCGGQVGFSRKVVREYSCTTCSHGRYNPKHKLVITQNY